MLPDDSAAMIWLWYQWLGHPSFSLLQRLFHSSFLHNNVSKFKSDTCKHTKHHRVSFPLSFNKSFEPFVIVHSNVWDPSRVISLFGFCWFVSFIDDYYRTTWVYLLKDKRDVFLVFKWFRKWFKLNLVPPSKLFVQTMGLSICLVTFAHILVSMALPTRPPVLTLLNRIELLSAKIGIFQR